MKDDILVSVVIPTYSRNETLERALIGILGQTYQNLDIIVVDDNPTDSEWRVSTQKIMEKYSGNSKIRYIQNKENLGGAGARNVGIRESKGEYIAFLDDDDEYYPQKIEKQLQVFLDSPSDKLALVYCDVEHVGKNEHVDCTIRKRHKGACLYEAIADDCIASTSMWLVKKSALQDVNNFSLVPCKQDSTVIVKLLAKGYEVDYVPEVLCKYHNASGGIRISFGPRKVEGELLFYQLCQTQYSKFTKRQIDFIEYGFAQRLYLLYWYQREKGKNDRKIQCRRMWKLAPQRALIFFTKQKWHQIKRRRFNQ